MVELVLSGDAYQCDIVEAHCYVVDQWRIDFGHVYMWQTQSITADYITFWPRRPPSTAYKIYMAETSKRSAVSCY